MKKTSPFIVLKATITAILTTATLSGMIATTGCDTFNNQTNSDGQIPDSEPAKTTYPLTGGLGSLMRNEFFTFKVNSATPSYEVGEKIPETTAQTILKVNITVMNITSKVLNIGAVEFPISWGSNSADSANPLADITPEQFAEKNALQGGQIYTADLYYRVPANQTNFALKYTELFDNEGKIEKGNTYTVTFSASPQDPSQRLGQVLKHKNFSTYHLVRMAEYGETKTFSYVVTKVERQSPKLLEVEVMLVANDDLEKNIEFLRERWKLCYGETKNEVTKPLKKEGYLPETILIPAGLVYTFTLGFTIPETVDGFVLEYDEYNSETYENIVHAVYLS